MQVPIIFYIIDLGLTTWPGPGRQSYPMLTSQPPMHVGKGFYDLHFMIGTI